MYLVTKTLLFVITQSFTCPKHRQLRRIDGLVSGSVSSHQTFVICNHIAGPNPKQWRWICVKKST